jgi:sulfate permease, SulP family
MGTSPAKRESLRSPLLQGILPFNRSQASTDILAGVTLAALAIPEVMGYTKISGTPLITGLYTILIPMTLYALFGSSRHLVVGADSATAAILAGGIAGLAKPESSEWLALAGILAFLTALFILLARLARLGFLADFLSRTVLVGFLTGVGIEVAAGEISGMLGLPGGGHGMVGKLIADIRQIGETNLASMTISMAVLIIVVGSRKVSKIIPGALIAVIGTIVASWALNLRSYGVDLVGAVPSGLPTIRLPENIGDWDEWR